MGRGKGRKDDKPNGDEQKCIFDPSSITIRHKKSDVFPGDFNNCLEEGFYYVKSDGDGGCRWVRLSSSDLKAYASSIMAFDQKHKCIFDDPSSIRHQISDGDYNKLPKHPTEEGYRRFLGRLPRLAPIASASDLKAYASSMASDQKQKQKRIFDLSYVGEELSSPDPDPHKHFLILRELLHDFPIYFPDPDPHMAAVPAAEPLESYSLTGAAAVGLDSRIYRIGGRCFSGRDDGGCTAAGCNGGCHAQVLLVSRPISLMNAVWEDTEDPTNKQILLHFQGSESLCKYNVRSGIWDLDEKFGWDEEFPFSPLNDEMWPSNAVVDDFLYCCSSNGDLFAYDLKGEKWHHTHGLDPSLRTVYKYQPSRLVPFGRMSNDLESSTTTPLVNGDEETISTVEWLMTFIFYGVLTCKFLPAVIVGAVVVSNSGVSHFALHTQAGLAIYITSIVLWFLTPCCLTCFGNRFPCNCLALLSPVFFAIALGFSCSYSNGRGKTVLEALILVIVATVSLSLYSLGAMIKRANFNLHPPFIVTFFVLLCIYVSIQIFNPFAKLSTSIWGFLAALFCWANAYCIGYSTVKLFDSVMRESIVPSPVFDSLHSTFTGTSSS
ncbi:Bax inhibitor 1-related protein [Corchorus capsularis]|uniref:Bax inhibitor 1-related protein n=1 Tax=Corchorus capsularis TaxID=210143 RepID=A0A1R3IMI1_COCAP|nr:Bax inhibitor 1-related protein [Corchorus capsularis]